MAPNNLPYLKLGGVVVALALLVGYVGFQARGVIAGPALVISAPLNGATVEEGMLAVAGNAPGAVEITLNDQQIFSDPEGYFSEDVLLAKGYNVLTVRASDRFGRTSEEVIEVIYK